MTTPAARALAIDGARITDIASFYAEIDRVFRAGVDWPLGHSLDALDDVLHGGYGVLAGDEPVVLTWRGFEVSRAALGVPATRRWLQAKLAAPPGQYDVPRLQRELAALEAGTGPTYFDLVLSVFADHPNMTLVAR